MPPGAMDSMPPKTMTGIAQGKYGVGNLFTAFSNPSGDAGEDPNVQPTQADLERWREEQEHREDGGHNAEKDVCEARVVVAAAVHLAVDAPELQSKGPGSEVRRDEDASSFTDTQ